MSHAEGTSGGAGARPRPAAQAVDTAERGRPRQGAVQRLDRRLFFLLTAWRVPGGLPVAATERALAAELRRRRIPSVLYRDATDPRGLGVLTWSEDEEHFVGPWREVFEGTEPSAPGRGSLLDELQPRAELTMFGRTYATGYEEDLAYWLLRRPVETVLEPRWKWAVWYPLRRRGAFEALSREEQGEILREHGAIGRAYGEADLAHDVRLACHGLDSNDNEFVIGLVGARLQPLSHVVQAMRRTRQTRQFIQQMGPFFVGRAVHRVG